MNEDDKEEFEEVQEALDAVRLYYVQLRHMEDKLNRDISSTDNETLEGSLEAILSEISSTVSLLDLDLTDMVSVLRSTKESGSNDGGLLDSDCYDTTDDVLNGG